MGIHENLWWWEISIKNLEWATSKSLFISFYHHVLSKRETETLLPQHCNMQVTYYPWENPLFHSISVCWQEVGSLQQFSPLGCQLFQKMNLLHTFSISLYVWLGIVAACIGYNGIVARTILHKLILPTRDKLLVFQPANLFCRFSTK